MNKRKLIQELKAKGAHLIRQGGGHEVWESESGYRFTVPQHNEIKERLAKAIIKQANN